MQMVKIQIPDPEQCAKAFAALIRRGRVDCFRDNIFIVPEPALEVLASLSVGYIELLWDSGFAAAKSVGPKG
jgi:hypothetical protein